MKVIGILIWHLVALILFWSRKKFPFEVIKELGTKHLGFMREVALSSEG